MPDRYKEAFCGDVRHLIKEDDDVASRDERDEFHKTHYENNQIPNYQRLIDCEAEKFQKGQKPQGLQKYFSAMFDKEHE